MFPRKFCSFRLGVGQDEFFFGFDNIILLVKSFSIVYSFPIE